MCCGKVASDEPLGCVLLPEMSREERFGDKLVELAERSKLQVGLTGCVATLGSAAAAAVAEQAKRALEQASE